MTFFYINTELPRTGSTEHFPGAGVVWEARPSHHIFNSRKQSCHQNVLQSQSAVRQSQRSSLLCSLHSTRAALSPDSQWGSPTWKCSTPSALASPRQLLDCSRDLLTQQCSCWEVCPVISKQQLSSSSNGFMWWSEWDRAVSSPSLAGMTVGFSMELTLL